MIRLWVLALSIFPSACQLLVGVAPTLIVEASAQGLRHPSGAVPYYSKDNRIVGLVIYSPTNGFQELRKSGFECVVTDFLYGVADRSNELGFSGWSACSLRGLGVNKSVEWLIYVGGLPNDPQRIETLVAEIQHMGSLRACMIQNATFSRESLRQFQSNCQLETIVLLDCGVKGQCSWKIRKMILTKDRSQFVTGETPCKTTPSDVECGANRPKKNRSKEPEQE